MREKNFENITNSEKKQLSPKEILKLVKEYEASGVDSGIIDRTKRIDMKMKLTEPMIKVLENIIILENGSWEFDPAQIEAIIENIKEIRANIKQTTGQNNEERGRAEAFANFFDNADKITIAQKKANPQID